jgi:hypothetical protein
VAPNGMIAAFAESRFSAVMVTEKFCGSLALIH